MILRFNRDEALVLDDSNTEVNVKQNEPGVFTYTVRKLINTGIDPDIFFSPFEIINLIMSITVQSIELTHDVMHDLKKEAKERCKNLKNEIE